MTLWTLHAAYDPDARVWYMLDCDVPGLVTEGDTIEHLRDRAVAVMPELIAGNAEQLTPDRRERPHTLRLLRSKRARQQSRPNRPSPRA